MIVRTSIKSFVSMREAYAAILVLEADYLKTHRRKHSVDLTLSSTSTPVYDSNGRLKLTNEEIEIRAVYDDKVPGQLAECQWFAGRASETVPLCY